jgi:hypothetical protein
LEQSFAETKTATQSALYVFRARRADWVKLIWQIPLAKRKELSVSVMGLKPEGRGLIVMRTGARNCPQPWPVRLRAAHAVHHDFRSSSGWGGFRHIRIRDQGGEGDEHSRQSANGAGVNDTSLDFVLIEREPQLRVAILIKLLQWVSSGLFRITPFC